MGKVKDESNFKIYGWMSTKLKLKGNELFIYAIIYSFSQNNKSEGVFNGSIAYLCEWTGIARKNVINILSKMVQKNLIIKLEDNAKKRKPNVYTINRDELNELVTKRNKNSDNTSYETLPTLVTKRNQTSNETLPNNNIINTNLYKNMINTNNNNIIRETEEYDYEKTFSGIYELYIREITGRLCCSPHEIEVLTSLAKQYGTKEVGEAIRKAVEQNKKSIAYIRGILTNGINKPKQKVELTKEYDIPF